MTIRNSLAFTLLLTFAGGITACDDDAGDDGETKEGATWEGETPHLSLDGSLAGEEVALSATGADAADVGTLYCERNYIVPDLEDSTDWAADGYLQKVEVKFNFTRGDSFAEFQLELENDDLLTLVGETLEIGDDTGVEATISVDEDGPNAEEFTGAAVSGTVKLELLSGSVGEDGLTIADGEGAFGASVDVEMEDGSRLTGSFTAKCGDNDLEIPE